ncbi:hypothetical protein BBU_3214 [Burkholderia pseudomallei NAU35A-3]|nr:hypothetical protein BBU_3214 [Burkholderia pseudomallei NAU35A-3]
MRPRDSLLLSVGCESAGARRRFAAAMAGGVAAATAAAAARKHGARACARCAAVRSGDGSIRSRASPRGHRAASPTESNGAAGRRCDRMTPRRSNDTLLDLRQAGSEPRHAPKRPRAVSGMRAAHDAMRAAPRFPCAPRATTPLHGRRNARRAGMRRQSRAARAAGYRDAATQRYAGVRLPASTTDASRSCDDARTGVAAPASDARVPQRRCDVKAWVFGGLDWALDWETVSSRPLGVRAGIPAKRQQPGWGKRAMKVGTVLGTNAEAARRAGAFRNRRRDSSPGSSADTDANANAK